MEVIELTKGSGATFEEREDVYLMGVLEAY